MPVTSSLAPDAPGQLWQLIATGPAGLLEDIEFRLAPILLASTEEVQDDGTVKLGLILSAPPMIDVEVCDIEVAPLPRQDWLALGARGAAGAVGPFTLVTDAAEATDPLAIVLDGKHAFGDGHHATTQGCLCALGGLQAAGFAPARMADIGCGTGVLGIAALKLWPNATASASDLHLPAVAATRAAAARNGVADRLQVFEADGFAGHEGACDLILMNILLRPLMLLADEAVGRLAPGGALVLSGILDEQGTAVRIVYRELGLAEAAQSSQDGWMTLVFRKPA